MADRAVSELIAAEKVLPTDLFVLEQSGTAKKLTGQVLENWLVSFADGHGGIQSIRKINTQALIDSYRITLADQTVFDFTVTNGKSIVSVVKSGTSGLTDNYTINFNDESTSLFSVKNGRGVTKIEKTGTTGLADTYTVSYNDNTTSTFTVTNGAKGDKGDAMYIWIKYASQQPTESSHSFGDVIDRWIGVYSGQSPSAPADWQQYQWFEIKGRVGDTGTPATLLSSAVEYQISNLGNIVPSGVWSTEIPNVVSGQYLWTRVTQRFNTGDPVVYYSISKNGLDGKGAVSTVAGITPDSSGNVNLKAIDVKALSVEGGTMQGPVNMGNNPVKGLPTPTENGDAVPKGYAENHFAPNGFGLGTTAAYVDNPNNIAATGFYICTLPEISNLNAVGYHLTRNNDNSYAYQGFAGFYSLTEFVAVERVKTEGKWQAWEYVNPPMAENVEYRTTERYNGKPVYKKLVNFGSLPNNGVKSVDYAPSGQASICKAIAISGRVGTGSTLIGYPNIVYAYAESGKVQIKTDTNLSAATVVVEVHYFKTTD